MDLGGYCREVFGNSDLRALCPQKAIGEHYRSVFPTQIAEIFDQHLFEARTAGQVEVFRLTPTIGTVLRDLSIKIQDTADGGKLVLINEMRESQREHLQLAERERLLAEILSMMPDLITILDDQGYYREFVGNFSLAVDSVEEKLNTHYREHLPEGVAKGYEEDWAKAKETGEVVIRDLPLPTVKGMVPGEARVKVGENGKVLLLLRDITERKVIEDALAKSTEQLALILSLLPDLIIRMDKEGYYRDFRGNLDLMATRIEDSVGRHYREILSKEVADAFEVEFKQCIQGKLSQWDMRAITLSGKRIELEVHMRFDGSESVVLVLRDVTEKRAAEQAILEAKNAAERANTTKSNFLAAMSHELRTPMNGVLGIAQLLQESDLTLEQKEYVGVIMSSGLAMVDVVSDIMDLNRLEADSVKFLPRSFELEPMLQSLVRMFLSGAKAKKLALNLTLDPGIATNVESDPSLLKQALSNLIGNAVKFTDQGSVVLQVKLLASDEKTQRVRFEVVDTGIGIQKNVIPQIFDPFFQADSDSTRRYGGTGLGLTLVDKLVNTLGGKIEVESYPGQGSRFWFDLDMPVRIGGAESKEAAAKFPIPTPQERSRYKVLIVEDDRINQLVAMRILQLLGVGFGVASNGKEALDSLKQESFDLVLMDCLMPVMDGFEATREIRKLKQYSTIPIIALTAKTGPDVRRECLEQGMDDYLSKPVDVDLLRQFLDHYLHSKSRFLGGLFPELPPK
ncbi:MAG: hypothetical protein A2557_01135 [Candidatus Lambdaproteobacteria bacterium RIFOXYD2_FULL_56_26]|uniref:histidine kinase n=1 Tax=Candidatus Lambdaproteobacteria bacterium RIFOXYD2_FULL_56_26 TaxID=1817773 RepID=A0A1F6GZG8_9PROT|nr:MAG: hypothetical protein A2557_01135 [Candidatus Lambdaproteobacteria bacterium RIFOXYD2_FULL_56_26]